MLKKERKPQTFEGTAQNQPVINDGGRFRKNVGAEKLCGEIEGFSRAFETVQGFLMWASSEFKKI
ncbi:hypothetical protein HY991_01370 [Candidatus Micrarchaeota archaeon]|nr:hypothetical protein [Candidatus Micrarchaeota archaeon]